MKLLATLNDGTIVNVVNLYIKQGFLEYCNAGMTDYAKLDLSEVKYFDFKNENDKIINNKILEKYLKFIEKEVDKATKEVNDIKVNSNFMNFYSTVIPENAYNFYKLNMGL